MGDKYAHESHPPHCSRWQFDAFGYVLGRASRGTGPVDTPSNRASSPFRVRKPGLPSSSVCIRLPGPAGLTHLSFRKSRNWRLGIGPTGVAPPAAVEVEWVRSELAT